MATAIDGRVLLSYKGMRFDVRVQATGELLAERVPAEDAADVIEQYEATNGAGTALAYETVPDWGAEG